MYIYLVATLLSMIAAYINSKRMSNNKTKLWKAVFWTSLPLMILAAFRYKVGTDYNTYYNSYWTINKNVSIISEYVYVAIVKALYLISADPQFIFIIHAIVFFWFLYPQVFKDSPYPALSIFVLVGFRYYFAYLNIMRQLTGCAILVYSIRYIEEDDFKKFLLCLILATGFHYSCAIFIIVYFMRNQKISLVTSILVFITLILLREIIAVFVRDNWLFSYYANYIKIDASGDSSVRNIFLQIFLYCFAYIFRDKSQKYKIYLNCQFYTVVVMIFSGLIDLIERVRFVFGFPVIILLPLSIKNIKDKKLKYLAIISMLLFFSWYVWQGTAVNDMYNVLPYQYKIISFK